MFHILKYVAPCEYIFIFATNQQNKIYLSEYFILENISITIKDCLEEEKNYKMENLKVIKRSSNSITTI